MTVMLCSLQSSKRGLASVRLPAKINQYRTASNTPRVNILGRRNYAVEADTNKLTVNALADTLSCELTWLL